MHEIAAHCHGEGAKQKLAKRKIDAVGNLRGESGFANDEVRLKRLGITTPGLVETIAKEGMPVFNQHQKFGNLVVTYQVDFPKKLTEKQKGEVKKLFAGTF